MSDGGWLVIRALVGDQFMIGPTLIEIKPAHKIVIKSETKIDVRRVKKGPRQDVTKSRRQA